LTMMPFPAPKGLTKGLIYRTPSEHPQAEDE
jgi:hypothetical protein